VERAVGRSWRKVTRTWGRGRKEEQNEGERPVCRKPHGRERRGETRERNQIERKGKAGGRDKEYEKGEKKKPQKDQKEEAEERKNGRGWVSGDQRQRKDKEN